MDLDYDIKAIKNEDLLRKMWQQTEDSSRRKEIHSHLYKLRESRLRDLYRGEGSFDIMADNSGAGFGKDPIRPYHGDSLADQSFQGIKSKEVSDSSHDMKFHALSLNHPNSTGWDVQTSSEATPDGRAFRSETIAKTDGVERINGGVAEFQGRNEQRSSASHEGDDKNYVKKAAESSNTHLQEHFVTGDEHSGRTEMRTSSKSSSSTQKVVSSSTTYDDGDDNRYLMDVDHSTKSLQSQYEQQQREQQRIHQEHRREQEQQKQQQQYRQHQEELQTRKSDHRQYEQSTEEYRRQQQESNTSTSVETERIREENKRYIDMDKASPEYQQRVKFLMSQPGEIISNIVEYPKPNVKMITTVKRLPDGTIVKNKRYETEELRPTAESTTRQRQVSTSNQSNTQSTSKTERRVSDQENIYSRLKNTRERQVSPTRSHDGSNVDNVDNVEARRQPRDHEYPVEHPSKITESHQDHYTSDATNVAKFSSVKKSSQRFSSETTSETMEEVDDHSSPQKPLNRNRNEPQAFSTHGFPSVRSNKPTQEYPGERPKPEKLIAPNKSTTPTDRDDVVIIQSEKSHSVKHKTNVERVIETEISTDDHHHHHPEPGFSTHGFPSVKASSPLRESTPRAYSPRSPQHSKPSEDFSTHGFPSVKETSPSKGDSPRTFQPNSPHRSQPREDFTTHGFPSVKESSPYREGSPRPSGSRPRSHPTEDFSTHGFPSVRSPKSPNQTEPDAVTRRVPIVQETPYSKKSPRKPEESTSSPTKKHQSTTESTSSTVRKEKQVDAAHRAFAASLRSSSPVDSTYSDHQRSTPRSSIASSKTPTRRDTREGSHDSATPSETSRISTSTVTRHSPTKGTAGRPTTSSPHVTKQTTVKVTEVTDTTPQRFSKSPSPGKTTTTTTTTKKTTVDVPKPDNQLNKPAASQFPPINEPLTITKTQFQTNEASLPLLGSEATIEEPPCIKKQIYQCGPSDKNKVSTPNSNVNSKLEDNILADVTDLSVTATTTTIDATKSKTPLPTTATKINQDVDDDLPKHVTKNVELHEIRSSPHSPMFRHTSRPSTNPKHHKSPDREEHFIDERTILSNIESQIEFEDDTTTTTENERNLQEIIDQIANAPVTQNDVKPKDFVDNTKPIVRETTFEKSDAKAPKPSVPKATASVPKKKNEVPLRKSPSPIRQTESPIKRKPANVETQVPSEKVRPNDEVHEVEDEMIKQTITTQNRQTEKNIKTTAHEFIQKESTKQVPQVVEEITDGALTSKQILNKSPEPTSPTFRKKGLSRRETFEDRCRQILGMEDAGDTQGTFKPLDQAETPDDKPCDKKILDDEPLNGWESPINKKVTAGKEPVNDNKTPTDKPRNESEPRSRGDSPEKIMNQIEFVVRVEDCEDDETNSGVSVTKISNAEKIFKDTQKNTKVETKIEFETKEKTTFSTDESEPKKSPEKRASVRPTSVKETSPQRKPKGTSSETRPKDTLKRQTTKDREIVDKIEPAPIKPTDKVTAPLPNKDTRKTSPLKSQPVKNQPRTSNNEPTTTTKKQKQHQTEDSDVSIGTDTRKTTQTTIQTCDSSVSDLSRTSSPERLHSPVRETKGTPQKGPLKSSPTPYELRSNKPKVPQQSTTKSTKPDAPATPTKKPLHQKSPSKAKPNTKEKKPTEEHRPVTEDLKDGRDSSPEISPTRLTERRRSSNISVHTEITIDHTPESPTRKTSDTKTTKITKTDEDLLNRALIQKHNKKLTVTERKESAPVHRVTRKDTSKDVKMSRSTSENVIKSSPFVNSKPERAPTGSRPNKCLNTKSINLTTMDRIINSDEMENVVIDIQHAKSSREPSPDKIVPTPVSSDFYTGKPRYPDVVQEPEDEPRRKPVVKNIPIFEEDSNDFVGCQIMEIEVNKTIDSSDNVEEDEHLDSPTVEAPKSIDFPLAEGPGNTEVDVCLLSVHDKVTKFTHTAEAMKKPQPSKPFVKDTNDDRHTQVLSEDDECLLSVDQKVEKFLKTAEKISSESYTTTREFDVAVKPTEKLASITPQRSPKLVATIERQISRPQTEPEKVSPQDTMPVEDDQFSEYPADTIRKPKNTTIEPTTPHSVRPKDSILKDDVIASSTQKHTTQKKSTKFMSTETEEHVIEETDDGDGDSDTNRDTYALEPHILLPQKKTSRNVVPELQIDNSASPTSKRPLKATPQDIEKIPHEDRPLDENTAGPLSQKPQDHSPQRSTIQESQVFISAEKHTNEYTRDEAQKIIDASEDDDSFTKSHTTNIELKRQKDILSRPSVFGDKKIKPLDTVRDTTKKTYADENNQEPHDDSSTKPLYKKPSREVPQQEPYDSDKPQGPLNKKPQDKSAQFETVQVFITKEKHLNDSTKDEVREIIDVSEDDDSFTKSHTTNIELKRQKDILSRPTVFVDKKKKPIDIEQEIDVLEPQVDKKPLKGKPQGRKHHDFKPLEDYPAGPLSKKPQDHSSQRETVQLSQVFITKEEHLNEDEVREIVGIPEDDDSFTKSHTTNIELKRQKDILSRPSVFGDKKKKPIDKEQETDILEPQVDKKPLKGSPQERIPHDDKSPNDYLARPLSKKLQDHSSHHETVQESQVFISKEKHSNDYTKEEIIDVSDDDDDSPTKNQTTYVELQPFPKKPQEGAAQQEIPEHVHSGDEPEDYNSPKHILKTPPKKAPQQDKGNVTDNDDDDDESAGPLCDGQQDDTETLPQYDQSPRSHKKAPQQESVKLSQVFIAKEKHTSNYSREETRECIDVSTDDENFTEPRTSSAELTRQIDILSRPAVFNDKKKKSTEEPTAAQKPTGSSARDTERQTSTKQMKVKSSPHQPDKPHATTNGVQKPVTQNTWLHKSTVAKDTNVFKTKSKFEPETTRDQNFVGADQWINCDETTELQIEETAKKRQQPTTKTNTPNKTPITPSKKPANERHSPNRPYDHHLPLTSRSPVTQHSTKVVTTTKTTGRTVEHVPSTEQVERQTEKLAYISDTPGEKKPTKTPPKDSVAARRNLFEKGIPSKQSTPKSKPIESSPVKPNTGTDSGRRPSYMDHTKCSLEHIRRDSLEINKTHYSRKSSFEDDTIYEHKPNSAVQFNLPQSSPRERATDDTDNLCIEEIFDLHVLEQLLETVTSYEIRRRIRAQIRLVKKNVQNLVATHVVTTTTKTTKSSGSKEPRDRSKSPTHGKRTSVSPTTRRVSETRPQEIVGEEVHIITERTSIKTGKSGARENIVEISHDRSRSPSVGKSPTNRRAPKPQMPDDDDDKLKTQRQVNVKTTRTTEYVHKPRERSQSPNESRRVPQSQLDTNKLDRPVVTEHSSNTRAAKASRKLQDIQDRYENVNNPRATHKPKSSEPMSSPNQSTRKSSTTSTTTTTTRRTSGTTSPERSPVRGVKTTTTSQSTPKAPNGTYQHKVAKTLEQTDSATAQKKTTAVHTTEQRLTSTRNVKAEQQPDANKSPIWANRKNILKNPSTSPRSPATKPVGSTYTKVTSTSSKSSQQRNFEDTDLITSSYGIGPTDENGLPLFGIKALKKKSQTPVQPSETTKVTGYVIEEKYYADDKNSQPIVERKEMIYATDADDIEEIKSKLKTESSLVGGRQQQQIEQRYITNVDTERDCQDMPSSAIPSSAESTKAQAITTKYVRRGSVKEMSEKFIRKESSQSITEKSSSSYPKAGLILRTNSRSGVTDDQDTYDMRRPEDIRKIFDDNGDYDDNRKSGGEYRSEMSTTRTTYTTEGGSDLDESESESVKMRTQVKSQQSTRSFLNSSKESRVITDMDDVLERMRNADNVVEVGDTQEDQEARALLNKFLGASVIMSGVEAAMPLSTKQTRTSANIDSNNFKKQQIKTTRTTHTTKSESSSSPVACKTCDLEEIWDEEILKKLLEQATSYEERRKIRTRLRQLMAEREECKNSVSGVKAELASSTVVAKDDTESSASEYETIIEEVTDYSDSETEYDDAEVKSEEKIQEPKIVESTEEKVAAKVESPKEFVETIVVSDKQSEDTEKLEVVEAANDTHLSISESKDQQETAKEENEIKAENPPKAENSDDTPLTGSVAQETPEATTEQGESLIPLLQDLLHKNMPPAEKTADQNSQTTNSVKQNSNTRTSSDNKSSSSNSSSSSSSMSTAKQNNTNTNTSANNTPKDNIRLTTTTTKNTPQVVNIASATVDSSKNNSSNNSSAQNITKKLDQLNVPQREDSGTESGEDLRLIAEGIRDKLHMQSDTNLLDEVTTALNRLESSLKEGKDLTLDERKRNALLALVARLQTGLTAPEKLASDPILVAAMSNLNSSGAPDEIYEETSSPEADAHRTSRQRFAKRRNRNSRHTVGVSREELLDARRYMEDMLLMENKSSCTTPEASSAPVSAPHWFPLEKNASSGAILLSQPATNLYRPNQFVAKVEPTQRSDGRAKRPLSGDFSVSFDSAQASWLEDEPKPYHGKMYEKNPDAESDSPGKSNRFTNKKQLMKRANTIDIPKTKSYHPELETDSEVDDKGPAQGLKKTVQVNVKQKVRNVVPPFEPKTENDHKFLAFINKQTSKPGLGWNNSKSVSNWTNKFGGIINKFEVGAAASATTGKPPLNPGHGTQNSAKNYLNKKMAPQPPSHVQRAQQLERERLEQEHIERTEKQRQERDRIERGRIEQERFERERAERLRAEKQWQMQAEQERMERERLEREHFEKLRIEKLRIEKAARERLEMEQLEREQLEREQLEGEQLERERYERENFARMKAEQQWHEKIERERLERDRIERDRNVRDQIENERLARDRIERDRHVREQIENERLARDRMERERVTKERLEHERAVAQFKERERQKREHYDRENFERERQRAGNTLAEPKPINKFMHAPQSVFRPVDNVSPQNQNLFKPINLSKNKTTHTWRSPEKKMAINSPQQLLSPRHFKNVASNSVSPQSTSPIGLPWASKQTDSAAFKHKASKFEDKPQYEPSYSTNVYRHNSLRAANNNQQSVEHNRKRPSLPNTADPYQLQQINAPYPNAFYNSQPPPPPTNISFTYADCPPKSNYLSYPCLPMAVDQQTTMEYPPRSRADSLTNPQAAPLVLSSNNPLHNAQTDYPPTPPPQPLTALKNYQRQFDYASPIDSAATSPMPQTDFTDDDLDSDSNIMEYRVESKVMRKPQGQTAVRVGRRTNHMSDDEVYGKNSRAARSLLHTMKALGNNGNSAASESSKSAQGQAQSRPPQTGSPKICFSPDGRAYQAPIVEPLFPQLSSFEANRSPLYLNKNSPKSISMQSLPTSTQYHQNPTYVPPTNFDRFEYTQQQQQQKPAAPKVVQQKPTYPKQQTQQLQQRNRNTSASSNYSNHSSSVATPTKNWLPEPSQETLKHAATPKASSIIEPHKTPQQSPIKESKPTNQKPEIRPKPQLPPLNIKLPQNVAPTTQHQQPASAPSQPYKASSAVSGVPKTPPSTMQQYQKEHFTTTEKSETKDNDGAVVTTTTKVTTRTVSQAPKPVSPFAKFKQLDKQNSLQSPKSPTTPTTPGGPTSGSAPLFKFTDPALNARAATVKEQLLQWCQIKTKEYENVQITNFSTSWSDGLAFCALIHHFLPDAFDYSKLTPQSRKHNFELAFTVADEKAGIAPLLDVEDMVEMRRPDWKCVFVYVQSIYRRFRNCQ